MLSSDAFPHENTEGKHVTGLVSGFTTQLFRSHPVIQVLEMADGITARVAILNALSIFKVTDLRKVIRGLDNQAVVITVYFIDRILKRSRGMGTPTLKGQGCSSSRLRG